MAALPSPDDPGEPTLSLASILLSLTTYSPLFEEINDNHPEADIRHRFLGERAIRSKYVQSEVCEAADRYRELQKKPRPEDDEWLKQSKHALMKLDEALKWDSRVNDEDARAAAAPSVLQWFMDKIFRPHLDECGRSCTRAPNARLRSLYGSIGDPIPKDLFALRGSDDDDDFLRNLITWYLMNPANRYILAPCQRLYNRILGRSGGPQPQGLRGETLDILVSAWECVIAVSCTAASVLLLYNIHSMKKRLIAAPFLSLAFIVPVMFFSRQAMRVYTLTAANWAVLIVFLSTTNCYGTTG